MKQAATAKLRALKDLETVRKNAQLEQKRLSAEKRLQVTKRRNLEQKQHNLFSQSPMPAFRHDTNARGGQVSLDTNADDDSNYLFVRTHPHVMKASIIHDARKTQICCLS